MCVYIYIPGCLPQSASFQIIELDFLTYLLVVAEPWSFMQDLKVFMQPIHSPCLTWSLMLDERLAQSSPCIIIITFSIALYRCLFFHKFYSLSRSDHVENNSFHAWRMKFSFHQVFIHPQQTPTEWVMPILLRRCNLSKVDFRLHIAQCFCHISLYGSSNSSILDAFELTHDRASDF
jgi:hypothetical protein